MPPSPQDDGPAALSIDTHTSPSDGHALPLSMTDRVEEALVVAILDGTYPPRAALPGERDLAALLQVTRPTVREALGRLERDGWLTIQHGKSTLVADYWRDGGLNILSALARYGRHALPALAPRLLEVLLALAPAYAREAVARDAVGVISALDGHAALPDDAARYTAFDWALHRTLALSAHNPLYPLILNGLADLYEELGRLSFVNPEARASARAFYGALLTVARHGNAAAAEAVTRVAMRQGLTIWASSSFDETPGGQGAEERPAARTDVTGEVGKPRVRARPRPSADAARDIAAEGLSADDAPVESDD